MKIEGRFLLKTDSRRTPADDAGRGASSGQRVRARATDVGRWVLYGHAHSDRNASAAKAADDEDDAVTAIPDFLLGVLFMAAFLRTKGADTVTG